MNQIKCPHCGEVFTIDASNYESIVNQIKTHEFEEELAKREKEIYASSKKEIEILKRDLDAAKKDALAKKDKEIEELKHSKNLIESEYDAKLAKEMFKKDGELENARHSASVTKAELEAMIEKLKAQMASMTKEKESAIGEAVAKKENELAGEISKKNMEINELKSVIEMNKVQANADLNEVKAKLSGAEEEKKIAVDKAVAELNKEMAVLNEQLKTKEVENQLAVEKAVSDITAKKDAEVSEMRKQNELLKVEHDAKVENLTNSYEEKLSGKDREIAEKQTLVDYYKDLKTKMSTKMIGETLEQHCSYEFNRNRMGMFPKAYFEKDNDARTGSKGDFIFRDYDEDGTEIISIMFEMKNEADTTATKHRNEDFLKELDKDRNEKGCEYAILVSLLESDNELYNEGIVDVSYKYPKMYVIRPQFFVPLITLLRNAALNSVSYKKQLMVERNNNLDVANFESNVEAFKEGFGRNYELASKKFKSAIDEIDKTIDHLQKTKDALLGSENQLRLANNKAQELTIKKLTKNAPSVALRIEEARKK